MKDTLLAAYVQQQIGLDPVKQAQIKNQIRDLRRKRFDLAQSTRIYYLPATLPLGVNDGVTVEAITPAAPTHGLIVVGAITDATTALVRISDSESGRSRSLTPVSIRNYAGLSINAGGNNKYQYFPVPIKLNAGARLIIQAQRYTTPRASNDEPSAAGIADSPPPPTATIVFVCLWGTQTSLAKLNLNNAQVYRETVSEIERGETQNNFVLSMQPNFKGVYNEAEINVETRRINSALLILGMTTNLQSGEIQLQDEANAYEFSAGFIPVWSVAGHTYQYEPVMLLPRPYLLAPNSTIKARFRNKSTITEHNTPTFEPEVVAGKYQFDLICQTP